MPQLIDGTLVIKTHETDYHYWGSGKSLFETLLEMQVTPEIFKKYCLEENLLTDKECPLCHKATGNSISIIYCKKCGIWKRQ